MQTPQKSQIRRITICSNFGHTDRVTNQISLSKAPWDESQSTLSDRPETNPRPTMIARRRQKHRLTGTALGQFVSAIIREELMFEGETGPREIEI